MRGEGYTMFTLSYVGSLVFVTALGEGGGGGVKNIVVSVYR